MNEEIVLKSRTPRTSKKRSPKVVDVENNVPEETVETLERYKLEFNKQIANGTSRKERLEQLMLRVTLGHPSPYRVAGRTLGRRQERRQKLVRRHQAAVSQIDAAQRILDQINVRIEQISTPQTT